MAAGIRLAAIKFMQRVILVQTRRVADPRVRLFVDPPHVRESVNQTHFILPQLQNEKDPNLSMCAGDHPYIPVVELEAEGARLLETVVTMLYTSSNADVVTALINSWAPLVQLRPTHIQLVVTSLTCWRPKAFANQSFTTIKSVEKATRTFLVFISHLGSAVAPFNREIKQAIADIDNRIEKGAQEERARRAALKRPAPRASVEPQPEKRQKLDNGVAMQTQAGQALSFSTLPAPLVTELIVANLQAFSEGELQSIIHAYKPGVAPAAVPAVVTPQPQPTPSNAASTPVAQATTPAAPAAARKKTTDAAAKAPAKAEEITTSAPRPTSVAPVADALEEVSVASEKETVVVKEESVDPPKMDVDDAVEKEGASTLAIQAPEQEDEDVAAAVPLDLKALLSLHLRAPPPRPIEDTEKADLVRGSVARIQDAANDVVTGAGVEDGDGVKLWMMLIIRMVTRGAGSRRNWQGEEGEEDAQHAAEQYERQDQLRANLYEYVMADFAGRMKLATLWMNEEWYSDQLAADQGQGLELVCYAHPERSGPFADDSP